MPKPGEETTPGQYFAAMAKKKKPVKRSLDFEEPDYQPSSSSAESTLQSTMETRKKPKRQIVIFTSDEESPNKSQPKSLSKPNQPASQSASTSSTNTTATSMTASMSSESSMSEKVVAEKVQEEVFKVLENAMNQDDFGPNLCRRAGVQAWAESAAKR